MQKQTVEPVHTDEYCDKIQVIDDKTILGARPFKMKDFREYHFNAYAFFFLVSLMLVSALIAPAQDEEDEEFVQGEGTSQQAEKTDPVTIFNKGQDAHAKGDLKTALSFYDQALKIKPDFVEAEFQRATILATLGNLDEAEISFRNALVLEPNWNLAVVGLGVILARKAEYPEAETLLTNGISSDPLNYLAYNSLAEVLIRSKAPDTKLKNLLVSLKKLTSQLKAPASLWVSKGMVENALKDFQAAKVSLHTALSLDPKDRAALAEIIELSIKSRDTKTALEKSEIYVAFFPNSETAKVLLARSHDARGNSSEALEILDAIENPGKAVAALKNSIRFRENESIENLEKMLVTDDNNVSILGRLCAIMRTENPQKALDYCRKALELEKTNITYAIGYGAALVQLKQYPAAVAVFKKLLTLDAKNYTIRANLATALFQMQQYEEAKAEYHWIINEKPDLAVGFYFLAICYDKLEEYEDALDNYEKFLELANAENSLLEIEKVNLRLPGLKGQIKSGKGKKRKGGK